MSDHMDHIQRQRQASEHTFAQGSRAHVLTNNPLVRYLTRWRLEQSIKRLSQHLGERFSWDWEVLVLCAGEGYEGSILCDLGFHRVTVSDLSENGVRAALTRDPRLQGQSANAECLPFSDQSFGLVVIQDGLHHLTRPTLGFTEMLRVAEHAAFFLEPHDSLIGNRIGTRWEKNNGATNYVFRWTRKLVQDVASSYFGHDRFDNLSLAFWHHNIVLERVGRLLGGGRRAVRMVGAAKWVMDTLFGRWGNQFCGMIVRRDS
jgi:hypothetical protein